MATFRDRTHAGRALAELLEPYAGRPGVLVLGLPRGGVPVAFEIALALDAELDVFVVRKLGVPGHEELAMGALASGGVRVLNRPVIEELRIDDQTIARAAAAEGAELSRRERAFRGERGPVDVTGRTVLLVDDGLATGATMRAAIAAVRTQDPERLVVAVPVAPKQTVEKLRDEVDEVVCAVTSDALGAIGLWYDDFEQTSDEEVRELLEHSRAREHGHFTTAADAPSPSRRAR